MEYFVAIRTGSTRPPRGISGASCHYFPVDSRTAADELATTAAKSHRIRVSVGIDGPWVFYSCVWIEGSQSASGRTPAFEEWKQRWAQASDYSAQEAARLCCGWNPESDVMPDPAAYERAKNAILRAVRVGDLHPIQPRVLASREELFYGDGVMFQAREVAAWAATRFPAFPFPEVGRDTAASTPTLEALTTPPAEESLVESFVGQQPDASEPKYPKRAEWLRETMKKKKRTATAIESNGGPSHHTVNRILAGEDIGEAVLVKLATALGVDRADIPNE